MACCAKVVSGRMALALVGVIRERMHALYGNEGVVEYDTEEGTAKISVDVAGGVCPGSLEIFLGQVFMWAHFNPKDADLKDIESDAHAYSDSHTMFPKFLEDIDVIISARMQHWE